MTCRSAVLGRDRHEDNDGDGGDGLQRNDQIIRRKPPISVLTEDVF